MEHEVYHKRMTFDASTLSSIEPILEGMPGGLFIYCAGGGEELLYINSAVLRIFGCDTKEEFRRLTGYTFRGMVHPDDIDEVERSIQRQIANSIYDFDYVEYRIIQKDGSIRWIEDYGHFVHTEAYGDIFYVFIDDSTERLKNRMSELEKVNEELRATYARESQYRKAILYDAVSFFEVNLTKDEFLSAYIQMQDGQLKDFFEHAGIPRFEKYSDYVRFWMRDMDPDASEEYARYVDAGRLIECYGRGELEQTYDGWITDSLGGRHLYHYAFLLGRNDYTGDVITMAITKDMTEQVQKQNLLKSALNQAQTASIARNTFLQNMSHDIRTPLNAIIGFATIAASHIDNKDQVKDCLQKVLSSSNHLLSLINDILDMSRIESGKVQIKEQECNISELMHNLVNIIQPQVKAKQLELFIDTFEIVNEDVIADSLKMNQVFINLLSNAVKYTPAGGMVTFRISQKTTFRHGYGDYVFLVKDNGIGMAREFVDHIFEPFERESSTTKTGIQGTGLGMAITKNIVEMMGGTITVQSEKGKGS